MTDYNEQDYIDVMECALRTMDSILDDLQQEIQNDIKNKTNIS